MPEESAVAAELSPDASVQFGAIGNPKTYSWYRDWVTTAEDAGFALLTSGDSQSLWADPFVSLSVASTVSRSARLGVTVSNPRTRHPAVVASSLAALTELTGGRVVYGVSSGDSALRNIGLPPAKVVEVKAFVEAVKSLLAGEEITWLGGQAALRWASADVPVWIAAEGPKMQYLAGQVADGVLLSNALDPVVLARARENVRAGAESVGRSIDDVEIWCMAAMCFAPTEAEAIERLSAILAGTANHVYRFNMKEKDVPEELQEAVLKLQDSYDSTVHASPETAHHNAKLVADLKLVDFLADRSVIAGPPERCLERIKQLQSLGVSNILVHHQANEPVDFMQTFAKHLTPYLPLTNKALTNLSRTKPAR